MVVPQNYVILTFVLCQCGLFTSQALAGGLSEYDFLVFVPGKVILSAMEIRENTKLLY